MASFLNYLGQFRIYSLLDLCLLLIAAQADIQNFLGVVFLHLGFLVFLETQHSHGYRKKMPKWLWAALIIIGVILYSYWEVIPFLILSYLYTKKTDGYFGVVSPLVRGFQYFFLIGGLLGYQDPLPWIALAAICIRNLTGDLRDTDKDKSEKIKTLPVVMELKKNVPYIHLITMLLTSVLWWTFTSLPLWVLALVLIIEITAYNITPRNLRKA